MASFYELIQNFDILSYRPEIKVKGHSRFITTLGIILGLFSILTIIILSFFITNDVFSRTKFSIIYNLDNREIPHVQINEFQTALLLIDALGNEIDQHERYFNFLVKYWKIEIPNNYTQNITDYKGTYHPRNTIIDLPLRNCSHMNYTKFSSFYDTFSKVYKSGVCIDFTNFSDLLFGKYGGVEGYSFLNIYINKCVNNTLLNKTNCYPESQIDKKLSQAFLSIVQIENDIDSNNYKNPILEFYQNEILPISSTIFKNYFKDMNTIRFTSDNGFIFDDEHKFFSHRTDKIVESVDLRGSNTLFPGTFSQITIRCSGKTELYNRTYLKVPATFAYIGGILQAIILIGRFFVVIFSKNSMLDYLILNIFDFKEINFFLSNDIRDLGNSIMQEESKQTMMIKNFKKLKKMTEANYSKNIRFNNNINSKMKLNLSNKEINDVRKNSSRQIPSEIINVIDNNLNNILSNPGVKNKGLGEKDSNKLENTVQIGKKISNRIKLEKSIEIKKNVKKVSNNHDNSDLNNLNDMGNDFQILNRNENKFFDKLKSYSMKTKKNINLPKFLGILDLFCFKECIIDKKKRHFFKLASNIIDKKLSLEYLLKSYSNFEKLKLLVLTKEQQDIFTTIPNFKLEKHLSEVINLRFDLQSQNFS